MSVDLQCGEAPGANGVGLTRERSVAIITFDRPSVMNAWDRSMRRQIASLCTELDADPAVSAVVFTGAGQRAFGAGQDLREHAITDLAHVDEWIEEWRTFFGAIRTLGKPTVAALNGVAAGSAFQFALMADFRVGHPGVRMGQPEIRSGVASSMGPWIIQTMLGPLRASDLVLTGRMMNATECEQLGLLNRVVEPDAVVATAIQVAEEASAHSPLAFRLTKDRIRLMTEAGFQNVFPIWRTMLRQTVAASSCSPQMR